MKTIGLLILSLFIGLSCSYTAQNPAPHQNLEAPILQDSTKDMDFFTAFLDNLKTIDTIKNWTKIEERYLDQSTEGGEASYFYKDQHLLKVKAIWLGELGKKELVYFVKDTLPFFAIEKEFGYNAPFLYDSLTAAEMNDTNYFNPEKSTIKENKYFLNHNLSQLKNADIDAKEKELLNQFESLILKLSRE